MSHLFCFGFGYCASYVAQRLAMRGWTISGTATRDAGVAEINGRGYRGYLFDGKRPNPDVAGALTQATHILLSIPPEEYGDPAVRVHGSDIASSSSIQWIGYFSTVGVYGDSAGGWIDETTMPRPGSERGQRRLKAENEWLELGCNTNKCVMIFRLPGIYGPGRSTLDDLRNGTARRIVKPGQVFNRIHVQDIASAVEAAVDHPSPGRAFNITDDEPSPPQDVVAYAASLLGVPPPPELDFATAKLSPMGQSFYSENKRIANARMKAELGVQLQFPSYREGLKDIAGRQN
ncbi:MAG: NAD(P)-dependent oxidoreductase [Hyphomicrobium sp.]|nr:MAG: NAD(P)-dependent oxidoreductase [Hyphomicrobium sp.]